MAHQTLKTDPAWINYCGRDESDPARSRTIVVGDLEWTTLNLNIPRFRNGDPIPQAQTAQEWIDANAAGMPVCCDYDNNPAHADVHGKLYNRHAIMDERGLALDGWRIPTYQDWLALIQAMGDDSGLALKSADGWQQDAGTNRSGFNARPGGSRYGNGGFYGLGEYAIFAAEGDGCVYLTDMGGLVGGFPPKLGGRWVYHQGNDGLSVRLVRDRLYTGFTIAPAGVPNPGRMFINREATGRSGHLGNALTQCQNGDILAFYTNTSGIMRSGHLLDGWSEYRRSHDGGSTWGEPQVFAYSKAAWEANRQTARRDRTFSRIVTAAVTAPNGTVLAFSSWGLEPVMYHLSRDHGETWSSEPRLLDPTGKPTTNYAAAFVHDGTIYTLFMENLANGGNGTLVLYVSKNNGETFERRSDALFPGLKHQWYQTGRVLEDGRLVVYVYNMDESLTPSEFLYFTLSSDQGLTWSQPQVMHLAKRIRNPQMSDKVGGYYFMHGRSGNAGPDPGNLVLYKSDDGLHWDEGVYLNKCEGVLTPVSGQAYSANTVIRSSDPSQPNRLLIQASIGYDHHRMNTKHWWVTGDDRG